MLESRVLSQDGIEAFTSKVIPFLHITTRIPGKKYDDLLVKRGRAMFPTLAFLDADGRFLTTLHYTKRSLQGFEDTLAKVARLQKLRARAATDPQAAKDLLLLELDMKALSFTAARDRAKGMSFSPGERRIYEAALVETLVRFGARHGVDEAKEAVAALDLESGPRARAKAILEDLEIRATLRPILRRRRPGIDPDPPYHLAYALFRKGRVPSDKPRVDLLYWTSLSRAAFQVKDVRTFEAAVRHLRPALTKSNAAWLKRLEAKLALLKQQAGIEKQADETDSSHRSQPKLRK